MERLPSRLPVRASSLLSSLHFQTNAEAVFSRLSVQKCQHLIRTRLSPFLLNHESGGGVGWFMSVQVQRGFVPLQYEVLECGRGWVPVTALRWWIHRLSPTAGRANTCVRVSHVLCEGARGSCPKWLQRRRVSERPDTRGRTGKFQTGVLPTLIWAECFQMPKVSESNEKGEARWGLPWSLLLSLSKGQAGGSTRPGPARGDLECNRALSPPGGHHVELQS